MSEDLPLERVTPPRSAEKSPSGSLKLKQLTSHRPDDTLRIELEWADLPSTEPERVAPLVDTSGAKF